MAVRILAVRHPPRIPSPDRAASGRSYPWKPMKYVFVVALLALAPACIFVWEKDLVARVPDPAGAQETRAKTKEPVALSRVGDGKPVCGLGKEFHAGRRKELLKRAGKELLVFRGIAGSRANLAFRQDKNFWYLTGVESPGAALVLDGKSDKEILFLPEQDLGREVWDGEIWDNKDPWMKDLTGFKDVRAVDQLEKTIKDLLDGRKKIGTNLGPAIGLSDSYDQAGGFDSD